MSDIKITPSEIRSFASSANQWASSFGAIESSMRNKLNGLSASWKDIRFMQFYEMLSATSRNIKSLQAQFQQLNRDLNKMASRLEDEIKQQRSMINRYR